MMAGPPAGAVPWAAGAAVVVLPKAAPSREAALARVREALAKCPLVIVADAWPTDTTRLAQIAPTAVSPTIRSTSAFGTPAKLLSTTPATRSCAAPLLPR